MSAFLSPPSAVWAGVAAGGTHPMMAAPLGSLASTFMHPAGTLAPPTASVAAGVLGSSGHSVFFSHLPRPLQALASLCTIGGWAGPRAAEAVIGAPTQEQSTPSSPPEDSRTDDHPVTLTELECVIDHAWGIYMTGYTNCGCKQGQETNRPPTCKNILSSRCLELRSATAGRWMP